MANREDMRITKTKSTLKNSFFDMLEEMPIESITVNDLCDRAGVRRATFYKHFNDKMDFITYLIKDIRDSFDKEFCSEMQNPPFTADYYLKYVVALGDFFTRREQAFTKILASPMRANFIDAFMERNYIDTSERLKKSLEEGMVLPLSVPVVASMLTGGISYNIIRWFETADRPSIHSLLIEISKFVQSVLK